MSSSSGGSTSDNEGSSAVKVAVISSITGVTTAIIAVIGTLLVAPDSGGSTPAPTVTVTAAAAAVELNDIAVADYLKFENVAFSRADDAGPNAYRANIQSIKQLPPGMTAWIASRHIETSDPSGGTKLRDAQYGFSSACAIDTKTGAVDCGVVYLGSDTQTGDFWAWLVVTDSFGTQQLDTQARMGGVFNLKPDFDFKNFVASEPVRESRG